MAIPDKRTGWVFRVTVAIIVLPMLYVGGFGPACWFFSTPKTKTNPLLSLPLLGMPTDVPAAPRLYWPIGWVAANGPVPIGDAIFWYATRRHEVITLPMDSSGVEWCDSFLHLAFRAYR